MFLICKLKNMATSRLGLFWMLAFAYSCLLALAVQKLFLPMMPELHGGHGLLKNDAIVFHNAAVKLAAGLHANGWSEWSLFPPGNTGNVGVLAALYTLFGPEPAVFIPLNVAAHVTGAAMLLLLGPVLWPGKIGHAGGLIAGTLFIAFPSALQWYSQNHKDAFAISGILMMLYAWLRIQQTVGIRVSLARMFLLGLAGVALLTLVRPYFVCIVALSFLGTWMACFCVTLIQRNLRKEMFPILATLLFAGMIGTAGFYSQKLISLKDIRKFSLSESLGSESLLSKRNATWHDTAVLPKLVDSQFERISCLRYHFIQTGQRVNSASGIDEDRIPSTALGVLEYMPRALFIGLFAPFPDSWSQRVSITRLTGAVETAVWYCFFPGLLVLGYRKPSQPLLAGVVFCFLIIMLLVYVQPNIGTLYRMRFGFWMFLLLGGAIGWVSVAIDFLARIERSHQADVPTPTLTDSALSQVRSFSLGLPTLVASGAITMIITIVGYVGFLTRDLMLVQSTGLNAKTDSLFLAMMLPMVLVNILAIPISDAITGPFTKLWAEGNFEGGRYFIRKVLFLAGLVMSGGAVVLFIFAIPALRLILGQDDTKQIAEGAILLRLFTPVVLLGTWTVVGNAVLNALHRFKDSSLAQLSVPICSITAILIAPPEFLMVYAILGMVVGSLANAAIVAIVCHHLGIALRPSPASCSEFLRLPLGSYGWLVSAALFTAISLPVNYMFAGTTGIGGVSGWALGSKMILFFNGLLVAAVTTILLPHMAKAIIHHTTDQIGRYFIFLLIGGTWLGGIILLGATEFVNPVVASLLRGPHVTEEQIKILSQVLRIGLLQLPVLIVGAIMIKAAALTQRSFATVLASLLGLCVSIAVSSFLVPSMGIMGIAYASLAASVVGTLYLVVSISKVCGIRPGMPWILMVTWGCWVCASLAITAGKSLNIYGALGLFPILAMVHLNVWRRGAISKLPAEGK